MTIYALMLCAVVGGRVDTSSCQTLQPSNSLAECRTTIANQTRGVDLSHAATRLICAKREVAGWTIAE